MGGYDLLVLPKLAPPAVTTPQHGRGLESMPTKLPGHKFLRQFDSLGSNIWQHARHGQHPKNIICVTGKPMATGLVPRHPNSHFSLGSGNKRRQVEN